MEALTHRLAGMTSSASLLWCAAAMSSLHRRLDRARSDERGMTTETVIITAGLAALAVAVVAIIAARVRDRANQIP